jgi:hypothetical protein
MPSLDSKEDQILRLFVTISVFALFLACGGSDSAQTSGSAETPPVSAADGGGSPPTPEAPAAPAPSASEDPKVQSCLGLVRDAKYQQATPMCLAALDVDPDNQQVKDALAQARSESAKLADAQGAAEAAAGSAAGASKLGGADGGMNPGQ